MRVVPSGRHSEDGRAARNNEFLPLGNATSRWSRRHTFPAAILVQQFLARGFVSYRARVLCPRLARGMVQDTFHQHGGVHGRGASVSLSSKCYLCRSLVVLYLQRIEFPCLYNRSDYYTEIHRSKIVEFAINCPHSTHGTVLHDSNAALQAMSLPR